MKQTPMLYQTPMVQAILREVDPKTQTRRGVKHRWPHLWIEPWYATGKVVADLPTQPGAWMEFRHRQQDESGYQGSPASTLILCPYGKAGDHIWVKETFFAWGRWETRFSAKKGRDEWHFVDMTLECEKDYLYAADGVSDTQAFIKRRGGVEPMYWKRPAIFMPREASRITLEIVSVRVERLQDISEADARAEGITDGGCTNCGNPEPCGCAIPAPDARDAYCNLWGQINGPDSWTANPWVWVVEFRRLANNESSPALKTAEAL